MKVLLHAGSRHGDAHAVEVGDREKEDQHPENAMAVFHGSALAGWFILSQRSRYLPESVSRKATRYARHTGQRLRFPFTQPCIRGIMEGFLTIHSLSG